MEVSTTIDIDVSDKVATITLTPAEERKPPLIDHDVLNRIDTVLDEVDKALASPTPPRVVVLRSASSKFFCAGGNIKALATLDESSIRPWIEHGHRVFRRIEMLPVPTVAVVAGYALGGGLELALTCDIIYAASDAHFGQTEVRVGFVTGWGGGRRFQERVGSARARELSFSGRMIDANEAERFGLVQFVGDTGQVEERLAGTIADICDGAGHAVSAMKEIIRESKTHPANVDSEMRFSVAVAGSAETRRRVTEFLTRRR